MTNAVVESAQRDLCKRIGAPYQLCELSKKVGASANLRTGEWPIYGIRHPPSGDASGWYLWVGEYSSAADFFDPLHGWHLEQRCPAVLPYLGLAPGWGFIIAPGYEDVWFDQRFLVS